MINESNLERALKDLMNSRYAKTQMDIFYKGKIAVQVFNQSDVKKWDFGLFLNEEGGVVLNLFFHKKKVDSHLKFKKSTFYNDFSLRKMNGGKVDSYYSSISKNVPSKVVANRIIKIIIEVYEIEEDEPLEILVRSFD